MRIAITGAQGQLGRILLQRLAEHSLLALDRPDHDITDREAMLRTMLAFGPQVVIHAAAMTDVDGCARNPDLGYRVNALGTRNVALACAKLDAELLYVSTNEVFDGRQDEPYLEFDAPNPINPYGRSKLAGEWFAQRLTRRFYIVRTAWLFAPGGHNFVHKILQRADRRELLRVVTDEVGSPTYALDLAGAIAGLIGTGAYGIYHLVNDGACSRFDFARAALELSGRSASALTPISHKEFSRASQPPLYSALRNFVGAELGLRLRPWTEALADYLSEHHSAAAGRGS